MSNYDILQMNSSPCIE